MRTWTPDPRQAAAVSGQWLAELIAPLGQPAFGPAVLERLRALVPVGSYAVYRVGSAPAMYLSGSHGGPDRTLACWRAYLQGPHAHDRTLAAGAPPADRAWLCHITAPEVPLPHRAAVYDPHGMAERLSVVRQQGDAVLALNLYRHREQPHWRDGQIGDFAALAPGLLALVEKHLALTAPPGTSSAPTQANAWVPANTVAAAPDWRARLQRHCPALTPRELDVCERLLAGLTQDGIAADLCLSVPTVKTYRNRAFERLGIHFRNELFALAMALPAARG